MTTEQAVLPAKKRRLNPDASRKRILAAAGEVFAERGYAGARVEEISTRAQMSPRMLYHYFGSKEQLYAAVAYEKYTTLFRTIREVQQHYRDAPVLVRLRRYILTLLDAAHADENYIRFMQWESAGGWKMLEELRSTGHFTDQDIAGAAVTDIEEGIRCGLLRATIDPTFVVTMSGMLATYYPAYLPRAKQFLGELALGDVSTPRAREELADFFMAAITAPGAALDGAHTVAPAEACPEP